MVSTENYNFLMVFNNFMALNKGITLLCAENLHLEQYTQLN